MNHIAFDLGASGGKLFVGGIKDNNFFIEEIHNFKNNEIKILGSSYWDILHIYSNLLEGIKKASYKYDIKSLGIDSFSNDFGFINENGELISQVRCYRDKRTLKCKNKIDSIIKPIDRYYLSGNQISPSNTLMHLVSMLEDGQEFFIKDSYKMLLISDLLVYFLTGKIFSEYTISSVSEMFDFKTFDWNDEILYKYNINKNILPTIIKPGKIIGYINNDISSNLNINKFEVISVCEHDTASAFLSAPIKSFNSAIISSGTWSLVGTEHNETVFSDLAYKANIANEGGYSGCHRIMKNVMGSWIIQEIQRYYSLVEKEYSFDDLNNKALEAKEFQYFIDPDDQLFFTSGDMPLKIQNRCLEIYGDSPKNISEIVRCVLESLVFKYRYSIDILENVTNKNIDEIYIVGGGVKDKLLCQFTANACRRKVIACSNKGAAIGNIMVQMIACNEVKDIKEARNIIGNYLDLNIYNPENSDIWEKNYNIYKKLLNLDILNL